MVFSWEEQYEIYAVDVVSALVLNIKIWSGDWQSVCTGSVFWKLFLNITCMWIMVETELLCLYTLAQCALLHFCKCPKP